MTGVRPWLALSGAADGAALLVQLLGKGDERGRESTRRRASRSRGCLSQSPHSRRENDPELVVGGEPVTASRFRQVCPIGIQRRTKSGRREGWGRRQSKTRAESCRTAVLPAWRSGSIKLTRRPSPREAHHSSLPRRSRKASRYPRLRVSFAPVDRMITYSPPNIGCNSRTRARLTIAER